MELRVSRKVSEFHLPISFVPYRQLHSATKSGQKVPIARINRNNSKDRNRAQQVTEPQLRETVVDGWFESATLRTSYM
jgi:hypothetical protein